ncbi:MAG: cyclic dehypoxanthinyl futalosine synthase [Desulfuromonas sp.]|jgi:cyclic dehypoxanthinyl futalosine synthase|nr:cyclic dehypoxanthinyl futalosine synthase [Desulfuromonas thiophila]
MLRRIEDKLAQGQSLAGEDALWLLQRADLLELGRLADAERLRRHPAGEVSFVVDRNVNYSNVCTCKCRFCAFYREEGAADAYLLDEATIFAKVQELVDHGGTQLLMQGGIHPTLRIDWFERLFRQLRQRFPTVQIHSLSPAEIVQIARLSQLSLEDCLRRLRAAGLQSIPGGGAEVLDDAVRQAISPNKISWKLWAEVMATAHRLGMQTTATLMFGSLETPHQLVQHLLRVREMQRQGGGFTAFISWSYQPNNTELGAELGAGGATGTDYLRVVALSRLVLDNIPNIQASWVTQGAKMAQIALRFGANDLGGTMLEENVVAATGVSFRMSQAELIELARDAGFIPVRRTTDYRVLERYPAPL